MKNEKRNLGKEIKDVGILLIIVGIAMIAGAIYLLFSGSTNQVSQILFKYFPFLVIFGLIALLAGVIVRSIGKSKEEKFNSKE